MKIDKVVLRVVNPMVYDHEKDYVNNEKSHEMPSVAIPDEDWTIPELLEHYKQTGSAPDLEMHGEDEDADNFDLPDLEKFRHMDLVDQQEVVDEAKRVLKTMEDFKNNKAASERKAAEKKVFDDAVVSEVAKRKKTAIKKPS